MTERKSYIEHIKEKGGSSCKMLYNSFVGSVLEYCSVIWRPHYATHMLHLERVQKRFMSHPAFCEGKPKSLPSYSTDCSIPKRTFFLYKQNLTSANNFLCK